jgi:hypothetical protein
MSAVHFVERGSNPPRRSKPSASEWESGFWAVTEETARKLIGGDIHFHSAQDKPSHFGGTILSYVVCQGGDEAGRIIFRFQASLAHKGVRTEQAGWGNEKKFVWE